MPVEPGQQLENTIRVINQAFNYAGVPYWVSFGALWGLVKNNGIIPDHDLDLCTYYGQDYKRLTKALSGYGYGLTRCMINDVEKDKALYAAYDSPKFLHICVSFWYPHDNIRYYCHDSGRELAGVGVPGIGYYFRGVPAHAVDSPELFRMVEWPGIQQLYKIRVPRFPGIILDTSYPDWAYQKQRYVVDRKRNIHPDKMQSYHKGGAVSKWAVHVQSMAQWHDKRHVQTQLESSERKWKARLKNGK